MTGAVLHQTLHGYSDGHRLISSSLSLAGQDARTMQVMSDLSGPGVKPGVDGYLTGYPLEGVGKYVLARTWAAPEMPRPGCVWTHSLLIDNADLAAMTSTNTLRQSFRRPDAGALRSYASPIELDVKGAPLRIDVDERVRLILNALYTVPDRGIAADAAEPSHDETLVLAIWMQQWPRLRRAFSFCTLSGVERSLRSGPLDLQLAAGPQRSSRTRFPQSAFPDEVGADPALEPLLADLVDPTASDLREFLRRVGGDVEGGRRAMISLCRLYDSAFTHQEPDLSGAVKALERLDEEGRPQARSVRALIAREAMRHPERVDDDVFMFLVSAYEQGVLPTADAMDAQLGAALWRRSPTRFAAALSEVGALSAAADAGLRLLTSEDVIEGLREHVELAPMIVERRPDLLETSAFWRIDGGDDLVSLVTPETASKVATALIASGRLQPAQAIIALADANGLADVLNASNEADDVSRHWVTALGRNPAKAEALLRTGRLQHLWIVVSLARSMDPDQISDFQGQDAWLAAINSTSGSVPDQDKDYLAAFAMSRALGRRSGAPAQLMQYAYARLYRALEKRRLSYEAERLVLWRLDWGNWFGWEPHERLRQTVVDRFISGPLNPATFARLADEGAIVLNLFDEAARTNRGRRYLADVRKSLKNDDEKGMKARADYIATKIK
ncbi:GAP1-N1 domain-containing protein [Brevundimonas pondensis]|uniref:Uncharacterized protein n=1 Tax=Brevundimonas pondensis TaxID=2774189 RepID=A0ABX7SQU6_9CAUL|nr:hypothetical protein [Brevundimonas pondensis]QTC89192.1 hypothetical protein IFE19_07660 [Brevundimonas pondensis]